MDANGQDPGHLSRRERTRRQHREEIIAAATDLFAANGYEGTSMQMVADRAEISVGKLYLHFEGKEDLYRSVVEYHAGEMRRRALEAADPSLSPMDTIRARTEAVVRYMEENDLFVRFYVGEMESTGRECRYDDTSEHSTHMRELASLFSEAVREGEIPEGDPELLTAMVHGAAHAMMAVVIEREDTPYSIVADYVDRLILRPMEELKRDEKKREGGE